MNEYLLRAITRLFAIVAKERAGESERHKIELLLNNQVSPEQVAEYMQIFDEFSRKEVREEVVPAPASTAGSLWMDKGTEEFVEDWANIMLVCKRINKEMPNFQKVTLLLRLVELIYDEEEISEHQENFIFYISKSLNIPYSLLAQLKQFVFASEVEQLKHRNILIIDSGSDEDHVPCKHIQRPNLTGFIAVLYIRELESYVVKYRGISSIRLNGIAVRNQAIYNFPSGSNIRGGKMKPVYYSDVVSKFKTVTESAKLSLIADNISLKFKSGQIGLRDIHINERAGSLIGIMGASGSGKSTLIEVLNGRKAPWKGRVLINGIDLYKEPGKLKGLIGHVPQDDLLLEELTVYENLYFAAKFCFSGLSEQEIDEKVKKTMSLLGISDIHDKIVGNPLKKVISGGQRKRLNIGLELLREPAILFLDEPTSGLSSRDSENIMDLLKELSLKGRLIFTVIHQPSSEIFRLFDSLIILDVGGYQIYYGNPIEAVVYFRDIVNMIQRDEGSCPACGNVNIENIFNIIETRMVNEYGQITGQRRISPKDWSEQFKKRFKSDAVEPGVEELPATNFKIPSFPEQLKLFMRRDILSKLKNRQYLLVNFLEAPLLALIIGYFIRYYDPGDQNLGLYSFFRNPNIPVYFFMSIVVAIFMGLSVSGEEIIKDRKILVRERFLNLSHATYLTSKIAVLIAISAIQTLSFVLIGNYLLELNGMTFAMWAILFSSACFANSIGLNISAALSSVITIYILIPIILVPQLLFNGIAIEFDRLNPSISSVNRVPMLGDMMASRWAFEAAMVYQFVHNDYERHRYPFDKDMANAQYHYAFYLPHLQTRLNECLPGLRGSQPRESLQAPLNLLHYEIGRQLSEVGEDKFPYLDMLHPEKFDSATYERTGRFLDQLHTFYVRRFDRAQNEKSDYLQPVLSSSQQLAADRRLMSQHKNQRIDEMVKNTTFANRIIEYRSKLYRKVNPIYFDPENIRGPMDFRTHFYAPRKHFAGYYFDTLGFNLGVIWAMTLLAWLALYTDLLRRIIQFVEQMSDYISYRYAKKNALVIRKRLGI